MLKLVAGLGLVVFVAGFAPAPAPSGSQSSEARRCFATVGSFPIQRRGTAPVYLRVRTGQTLEIAADPACVAAPGLPEITVRPLGGNAANLCVGDSVTLEVESPSVIKRPCAATIARVVPDAEVEALPNRVRP